jgi:hypothetical protein
VLHGHSATRLLLKPGKVARVRQSFDGYDTTVYPTVKTMPSKERNLNDCWTLLELVEITGTVEEKDSKRCNEEVPDVNAYALHARNTRSILLQQQCAQHIELYVQLFATMRATH